MLAVQMTKILLHAKAISPVALVTSEQEALVPAAEKPIMRPVRPSVTTKRQPPIVLRVRPSFRNVTVRRMVNRPGTVNVNNRKEK